ncbi:MAG: hypothetical protein NVSMB49_24460 [Ktedonobacteraceae bacterium]
MGQYREWLHYRQVDQQLHALKDRFTTELVHVQEQLHPIEAPPLDAANRVIQALMLYAKIPPPVATQEQRVCSTLESGQIQQLESIAQPLFDHSHFPGLAPILSKNIPETPLPKPPINTYASLPPIPYGRVDLPWWLQRATLPAIEDNGADDPQNVRTNRLVQRWLERWGLRENQAPPSMQPNGHPTIIPQKGTER